MLSWTFFVLFLYFSCTFFYFFTSLFLQFSFSCLIVFNCADLIKTSSRHQKHNQDCIFTSSLKNLKNEIDIQCYKTMGKSNEEQILKLQNILINKVKEVEKIGIGTDKELSRNWSWNEGIKQVIYWLWRDWRTSFRGFVEGRESSVEE